MLEILSDIDSIGNNLALYQEKNFNARTDAIDHIEFHIIDRIEAQMGKTDQTAHLRELKQYAEKTKHFLEDVNERMFYRLHTDISKGAHKGAGLMKLMDDYFDHHLNDLLLQETIGYDNLDLFVNGILTHQPLPVTTKERDPEMVFYQKTPVRIVLELVKRADFRSQDVFFDLGSGLGQVTILVNLLTSVASKGVEIDAGFCSYARTCAADLNLHAIEFINEDARAADYSNGTVFFMYTPFEGKILQQVLHMLKGEAKNRKIRIFTYGPCTAELAKQEWLFSKTDLQADAGKIGEFISVQEMATTLVDPATSVE